MENYQIFFPGSSSPNSASPSTLDMANPQIYSPHGSSEHGVKTETRNIQHFDGVKMKSTSGKKAGDNKEMMRKHRYAFQTRSQVDILDDGYRWRKYGQKTVKNSKFPRSYYKCTHNGCNVKKQVQRNTKDEGIVVTTYDGVHTHPTERSNETFEEILRQMQTYTPF